MTGIIGDIFSERMYYNDLRPGSSAQTPRFNGSISAMDWSGSGRMGYNFTYDGLGRLTGAAGLHDGALLEGFGTSYSYDRQGNVMSIAREDGASSGEDLMMAYSGNRLHAMSDNGESMVPDHIAGSMPSGMTQYSYDRNGNMTRDLNSGLTAMSYNSMNLPEQTVAATPSGTCTTDYLYNADGVKLRTRSNGPSGESTTDYCSNLVYRDGALDRIMLDGGYIKDGEYRFFVTDHLGSVRAVADADGNVLERYDYYQYGKEFGPEAGMTAVADASEAQTEVGKQPYRFNGKESQEFASIPLLDYGARFYNPTSARWTTMDPMAEKYYSVSPYAFCSGNPVNFVDPDGKVVRTLDEQSRNNITNTLTEDESKYVKFNKNGELNSRRLNKSDSQSENMIALKSLSNSSVEYVFQTASGYTAAGGEYKEFTNGDSWTNGITLIPEAPEDASPDNKVYIITNSSLSPEEQVANTAHEAYGHAYFYELSKNGIDVNPFHKYVSVPGEEIWEPLLNSFITTNRWADSNTQLDNQIKIVVKQAVYNYRAR